MPSSILIADDYEDNRELLRLMLMTDGYTIREARNGRECVTMATDEPPDLVLVDLSMPELDGWGVLRELRADERTRAVPCVAVSASAIAARESALEQGFDDYLSKPFRKQELLSMVARLLPEGRGQ
ncbi:MAG TPA: response regulator [Pyrinomonadaceae bacterium]|jgi:CheY-like chemotaxis protein|nr:response regulator [Pyrinomonadaceae bacterium]